MKLKLSPETVKVLENFAKINKSIVVKPGSTLTTISESKAVIGTAQISETFPTGFAIYDLSKLLSSLSLFTDPEIEFSDKRLVIKEGAHKLNYTFDDVRTILAIDDETIKKLSKAVDAGEVEFDWKDDVFQSVSKARSILNAPNFVLQGDGNEILLKAQDVDNPTASTYEAQVGETDAEFRAVFRQENLKFLPRDYRVKYATRGLARFTGEGVTYYVTSESRKT